ncbi:2,5-diketo-D-gluconate reductase B [compost metagenome]
MAGRWLIQRQSLAALTKTATERRIAESFAAFDLSLDAKEMDAISGLARPDGRIVNPGHLAPEWD